MERDPVTITADAALAAGSDEARNARDEAEDFLRRFWLRAPCR